MDNLLRWMATLNSGSPVHNIKSPLMISDLILHAMDVWDDVTKMIRILMNVCLITSETFVWL